MNEQEESTCFQNPPLAVRLWNHAVEAKSYVPPGEETYRGAILEQYKLYVEMADRVSARRSLTNTFFLTLNTAFLAAVGAFVGVAARSVPVWSVVLVALVAVSQCGAWFLLLRSYRQLNTAKYRVIGEFERRLPALPYQDGEWCELGEGRSSAAYVPLTSVEVSVPGAFAALYLAGAILALALR